ncbi:glycosyltransferase family 4 protein [Psychroserpens ponticola]|uniref:Glycosyltransferase family 4 protein n=1 Tax=Psychroserpens ponticola TaxID=2932268 RepID=A0ABY7S1P0_9FLAO|nr:glycosyltransferase family 4 protein [Psychroserpens ponticola]WCO03094.1 glycosyltransferase family 4 protein [Psychroserpens ponticola]
MTIVHVNVGLGGGGAEHMILEMAKKSQQDQIETVVLAITDNDQIEYKFKESQLNYHYLGITSPKGFFNGIKKMKHILSNYDDVVLHCHMFHALVIGIYFRLFVKKVPIVFTLHNILVEEIYRRWFLFFTKAFRKIDINFSEDASKWYLKKIQVIANGVDFEKFKLNKERTFNKNETFKFLYLGRIEEQKNPLVLPDLAKKLLDKGFSNFEIRVAGNGDMKDELETLINKNNLEQHIKILGFQKDVKQQLFDAHCMIMPSLWEGLPISLIEASATKLPIITTPVGSIPKFFKPSNCFTPQIETFHEAMISAIENYDNAKTKANQLFEDNKNMFDINSVYKKHLSLYQSVTN